MHLLQTAALRSSPPTGKHIWMGVTRLRCREPTLYEWARPAAEFAERT
jgi:hypothetical protein